MSFRTDLKIKIQLEQLQLGRVLGAPYQQPGSVSKWDQIDPSKSLSEHMCRADGSWPEIVGSRIKNEMLGVLNKNYRSWPNTFCGMREEQQ